MEFYGVKLEWVLRWDWDEIWSLGHWGGKTINKCNQTSSKLFLEKTNDNNFWFTIGSLVIDHWQLVSKNKSFERVLKNVKELKSVCNECLKEVFAMRLIENLSVLECSRMF